MTERPGHAAGLLNRRRLLASASGLAILLQCPIARPVRADARMRAALGGLIDDHVAARTIADRAVAEGVLSPSPRANLRDLLADLAGSWADPVMTDGEVRARIARQIAQDFATGRTVSVQGWQLSVTEVRLCIIVSE